MLEYGDALATIRKIAREVGVLAKEPVALLEAVGRVAAESISSPVNVPPFHNSSMDGFAVRSEVASGTGPMRFKVFGSLSAGDVPPESSAPDGAWEIMTGAPFPPGFDACVKVEDTLVFRNERGEPIEIEIQGPVPPKQNWRGAGEDFSVGAPVLAAGQVVTTEHVLALASLGVAHVAVTRRPRVALLSTGRELAEPGAEPAPGQIRNSTGPYLLAALGALGVEVTALGAVPDDVPEFERTIQNAIAERYDLILTTGAVSMGKHDFVTDSVQRLGAQISFHKVAIRPGKPLLFGRFAEGPVFFGLPGNPVSGVVGLRFFVEPFLRERMGLAPERPLRGKLAARVAKPANLRCFFKARATTAADGLRVEILPGQLSFQVSPLLQATAWAVLPEGTAELETGAEIDLYPMHASAYDWSDPAKTLRVRLFGAFRECSPDGICAVPVRGDETVGEVKGRLAQTLRAGGKFDVSALLAKSVLASDTDVLADADLVIGTELSLLPPVCGG